MTETKQEPLYRFCRLTRLTIDGRLFILKTWLHVSVAHIGTRIVLRDHLGQVPIYVDWRDWRVEFVEPETKTKKQVDVLYGKRLERFTFDVVSPKGRKWL